MSVTMLWKWGNDRPGAVKAKLEETLYRRVKTKEDFLEFWKSFMPLKNLQKVCNILDGLTADGSEFPYDWINTHLVEINYRSKYEFNDLKYELKIIDKTLALLGSPPPGVRKPKHSLPKAFSYNVRKAVDVLQDARANILMEIWGTPEKRNHKPIKRNFHQHACALVEAIESYLLSEHRHLYKDQKRKITISHACETVSQILNVMGFSPLAKDGQGLKKRYYHDYLSEITLW